MNEDLQTLHSPLRFQHYRLRNDTAEASPLAAIAERGIEQPQPGVARQPKLDRKKIMSLYQAPRLSLKRPRRRVANEGPWDQIGLRGDEKFLHLGLLASVALLLLGFQNVLIGDQPPSHRPSFDGSEGRLAMGASCGIGLRS